MIFNVLNVRRRTLTPDHPRVQPRWRTLRARRGGQSQYDGCVLYWQQASRVQQVALVYTAASRPSGCQKNKVRYIRWVCQRWYCWRVTKSLERRLQTQSCDAIGDDIMSRRSRHYDASTWLSASSSSVAVAATSRADSAAYSRVDAGQTQLIVVLLCI